MLSKLRRTEIIEVVLSLVEEDKIIRNWEKDEILHNMNFIWGRVGDKIVK